MQFARQDVWNMTFDYQTYFSPNHTPSLPMHILVIQPRQFIHTDYVNRNGIEK